MARPYLGRAHGGFRLDGVALYQDAMHPRRWPEAGLCHPGVIAQYINVDILLKAGSAGFAAVAIKGGYDRYMMRDMLNREQKARQHAEERLAEAPPGCG